MVLGALQQGSYKFAVFLRRMNKMGLLDIFKRKSDIPDKESSPEKEEVKTSSNDDLLSSIKQFREQQNDVREKFLQENDAKLAPTHEKIARAESFMEESGLNKSFPKVVKHIWHWASWSKQDSFGKYSAFKVEDIKGDKNGTKGWFVSFIFNGHEFKFLFNEEKSYFDDSSRYAEMSLLYNDEKVLQINCMSNYDREYDDWDYRSVNHLVIDEWVRPIVEMHELIKLYDLKKSREFGESMFQEQAQNLPD